MGVRPRVLGDGTTRQSSTPKARRPTRRALLTRGANDDDDDDDKHATPTQRRPHALTSRRKAAAEPAWSWLCLALVLLQLLGSAVADAFSIRQLVRVGSKRADGELVNCPTWHPFQCPNGDCIPIKYLCDGSPDCSDEYDENRSMCTAATRPPVEETAAFLTALLNAHGNDFLVKLFGPKARNKMQDMGGVDQVAVALSQSPTVEQFAEEMKLSEAEETHLNDVLQAIMHGAPTTELAANEAADFRFFVQKLQETGFF